jgi:hypothetical protein
MLCPCCSYDLTGLPEVHTCPECGFEYDALAMSITLRGRRAYTVNLISSAAMGLTYFGFLYPRTGFTAGKATLIIFLGIALLVTLYRLWKRETVPRLLLLSRRGLAFHPPSFDITLLPWGEITGASCSWVTGVLCITGKDGQTVLRCPYQTLGTLRIAKRCAAEINRLREGYSEATVSGDAPSPDFSTDQEAPCSESVRS